MEDDYVDYIEEFQDYKRDCWWWFVTYLELGATVCAHPEMSAKNTDFSKILGDYKTAAEEFQRQKRRSVLFHGSDDSE